VSTAHPFLPPEGEGAPKGRKGDVRSSPVYPSCIASVAPSPFRRFAPPSPSGGRKRLALAVTLLALAAAPALAVDPDEMLADRALEARARAISAEVRCVVCQNQSIDDSNAEIARDMRRAIRERLTKGDSDAQVTAFLRARYGDYVLLKPPFDIRTWLMWLGGPLVLVLAGFALWRGARRTAAQRTGASAAVELSAEERARVDSLLGEDPEARR